jgi:outer membrane protein OmpA-like peptidoglycan-associated protein
VFSALFALAFTVPLPAQEESKGTPAGQAKDAAKPAQASPSSAALQFAPGRSATVEGVIVKRNADSLTVRDFHGSTVEVNVTQNTEVKERKSNPFRAAHTYSLNQLVRGLDVEVNGHGSSSGALVADRIRFTDDDFRTASALDSRVNPVETDLRETETRLSQSEENALRLSGQVSELSAISNSARGGAKAAQETADSALDSAKTANREAKTAQEGVRAANERISSLDDFDVKSFITVNFKLGSAVLTPDAKAGLDKVAEAAKNERGFVIEVTGFASSEGGVEANRVLSQRRADAVIRYLADNHSIPLRRFITPFGYGITRPVADNKTREGRMQNRRVEVRILVSKALAQSATSIAAGMH